MEVLTPFLCNEGLEKTQFLKLRDLIVILGDSNGNLISNPKGQNSGVYKKIRVLSSSNNSSSNSKKV
jgi:hypothetical protein